MSGESKTVPKEFAMAIGLATMTFARIENLLNSVTLQLNKTPLITQNDITDAGEILTETLGSNLRTLQKKLPAELKEYTAVKDFFTAFKRICELRNIVIHGLWVPGASGNTMRCVTFHVRAAQFMVTYRQNF